jgi:SAM-dependent methyltransferase
MPYGRTLPEELFSAMRRLEAQGVVYPDGYYAAICRKYTSYTVPYPKIVMHVGEARIRRHFLYRVIRAASGKFLDYGCGTGDAVRQLIRDGYPRDLITGFDVNDASLNIGYDLYRDHATMGRQFIVSPVLPRMPGQFDFVYSGSVIHVIDDHHEFRTYLDNANTVLKNGGTFFGTTLSCDDNSAGTRDQRVPRLMKRTALEESFTRAGFRDITITIDPRPDLRHDRTEFCLYQFSARKPGRPR